MQDFSHLTCHKTIMEKTKKVGGEYAELTTICNDFIMSDPEIIVLTCCIVLCTWGVGLSGAISCKSMVPTHSDTTWSLDPLTPSLKSFCEL